MTGVLAWGSVAIVLAWTVFALAGLGLPAPTAAALGAVAGFAAVVLARDTLVLRGVVAMLAPLGVMLPALALRHAGARLGVPVQPFATAELAVFLVAHVGFLAAAFGVLPINLYRLGYAPGAVAVMVLAVCAYGAWRGNLFLPFVAVAGQAAWVAGWGSSNWFDHVLHALLVPVVVVVLLGRLVW